MTRDPNNGAFYIDATARNNNDAFRVPSEEAGVTPEGTPNPDQESYNLDRNDKSWAKQYYVHVKNGWDVEVDYEIRGSSFEDSTMNKDVVDKAATSIPSEEHKSCSAKTGHSYIEVVINPNQTPSSGTLEVVIQGRKH